jgi:hypothetical protein
MIAVMFSSAFYMPLFQPEEHVHISFGDARGLLQKALKEEKAAAGLKQTNA